MERLILTTGGTGGHIFPALAVAEELRRRNPGVAIVFMGGEYGPEAGLAGEAGLEFIGLPVRGIMGRGLRGLRAASSMLQAVRTAVDFTKGFRPQAVVGFGGYAAFAGVVAGRLNECGTAIHEQNAFPGMANRFLARIVDRVYLSMPDDAGVFPSRKTLLVGNPVRTAIAAVTDRSRRAAERDGHSQDDAGKSAAPRLLVMGGSLGAKALNEAMVRIIDLLLEAGVEVWHQTGDADYDRIRTAYGQSRCERIRLTPFISDVAEAYSWADLIVCRAGASSLAEIACAGLPAVLVPFPHAAQDHQRHNACSLARTGAAVMLEQEDISGDKAGVLAETLLRLLRDPEARLAMSAQGLMRARPDAAGALTDDLETLVAKRRSGSSAK